MDLILWRHAQAEDAEPGTSDLERALTSRGRRQAARMAAWLKGQMPDSSQVLVSPALRTEQTAQALGRKYKLRAELSPQGTVDDLLELIKWPHRKGVVLVVGHQPTLGLVLARLLGLPETGCAIRKGAVWWLRSRQREGVVQTRLVAMQSPEFLSQRPDEV